ncbi:terminase small subunit-like protein [Acetobacter farinalis]|uniref:terminase small subunit-like protein n=1 Tax=Acetobacter farinalis TaxID=1260984 RepID=UPI0038D0F156
MQNAREREDMPCRMSVFKWLRESSAFSDQYAHAREGEKAAHSIGQRLLKNVEIENAVSEAQNARFKRAQRESGH